jgi:hypothetical protein
VAHAPLRQRSQNAVSRVRTTVAEEDENYDDASVSRFDDYVSRPLRVVNIPDPSELEDIPGSEDESTAVPYEKSMGVKPAITVAILGGQHHEVWDLKKK